MHLTIRRMAILPLLKAAASVAGRSHLSILECVSLTAKDGALLVEATDFETRVSGTAEATVTTNGAAAAAAKTLHDFLAACDGEEVSLQRMADASLFCKCGNADVVMQGLRAEDFPAPWACHAKPIEAPWPALFRATRWAAPAKGPRAVLCGIHTASDGQRIRAEATDGKVAASYSILAPPNTPEFDVTLPISVCRDDVTAIAFGTGDEANTIEATTANGLSFKARTVSGKYPDVSRVWPTGFTLSLELAREDLLPILRRASFFAPNAAPHVDLTISGDTLTIATEAIDAGRFVEQMPVTESRGLPSAPFTFTFALSVIGEAVAASCGDVVTLSGNEPSTPWQITGEDPCARWLAMPIKKTVALMDTEGGA